MSPEMMAHLGGLIQAAESNALSAHYLLNPPGGITPTDDMQRVALAQAKALTAFAFAFTAFVEAAPLPADPPPSEPVP